MRDIAGMRTRAFPFACVQHALAHTFARLYRRACDVGIT